MDSALTNPELLPEQPDPPAYRELRNTYEEIAGHLDDLDRCIRQGDSQNAYFAARWIQRSAEEATKLAEQLIEEERKK